MRIGILLAIGGLCGCGDTKFMSMGDMAGRDLAGGGGGDMAMMMGMTIPDPGTSNNVDNNFGSTEPNDTPSQATPLGVSQSTMGVYVWVSGNTIGGGDLSDYFVFKSSPSGGPFTLGTGGLCFNNPPITSMTATLWTVQNNLQVNPPVHVWNSTGTCVASMAGDATLQPSTTYLLGVTAVGAAGGMYSA